MIKITPTISLDKSELSFTFIRSPGPGGQNVNKVASAVLLRFNIKHSPSLPDAVRKRLSLLAGNKITSQGDLIIKASRYRTQKANKKDALNRLQGLLRRAAVVPKTRKKTKPTAASKERRLTEKKIHSKIKAARYKPHLS